MWYGTLSNAANGEREGWFTAVGDAERVRARVRKLERVLADIELIAETDEDLDEIVRLTSGVLR
jgi:hypothetical protein